LSASAISPEWWHFPAAVPVKEPRFRSRSHSLHIALFIFLSLAPRYRSVYYTMQQHQSQNPPSIDGEQQQQQQPLHNINSNSNNNSNSNSNAGNGKRFLGVPSKTGIERIPLQAWQQIRDFISNQSWMVREPVLESDMHDPLLATQLPFGNFMLGFDFHLCKSSTTPKLIEINTNAGGLATLLDLAICPCDRAEQQARFVAALLNEYNTFLQWRASHCTSSSSDVERVVVAPNSSRRCDAEPLLTVAIVDDDVTHQKLYPEMLEFASILEAHNIRCFVVSPEDLELQHNKLYTRVSTTTTCSVAACDIEDQSAPAPSSTTCHCTMPPHSSPCSQSSWRTCRSATQCSSATHTATDAQHHLVQIDFLYNRITDFRLELASHAHIRQAAIHNAVCVSPHPAAYVRYADKRNLLRIADTNVIPQTLQYTDRAVDDWVKTKKQWVFKPSVGMCNS
jgi:hypothetical protein